MSDALVVGATGSAGSSIVDALAGAGRRVIAIARRIDPDPRPNVRAVAVDASQRVPLQAALASFRITDVYFAARARSGSRRRAPSPRRARRLIAAMAGARRGLGWIPGLSRAIDRRYALASLAIDPDDATLRMLQEVIAVTRARPHALRHALLVTGAMHYGVHMGPRLHPGYRVPFDDESSPRCPGPVWYHDAEDWLRAHADGWTWTVLRAALLLGHGARPANALGMTLVLWAALCKLRGEPARFPGDAAAQAMRWDLTPGSLLGDMSLWSSTTPAAWGRAFNCACGEALAWRELWAELAASLDVAPAYPRAGVRLADAFVGAQAIWDAHARARDLRPLRLDEICTPAAVDSNFVMSWDVSMTMNKAREAGFGAIPRLRDALPQFVAELRARRIVAV